MQLAKLLSTPFSAKLKRNVAINYVCIWDKLLCTIAADDIYLFSYILWNQCTHHSHFSGFLLLWNVMSLETLQRFLVGYLQHVL